MSNLTQRLITGSIFVVVLVGCLWFSAWTMLLLLFAITVLGLHEFYGLAVKAGAQPQKWYGIVLGGVIVLSTFAIKGGFPHYMLSWLIPALFLIFFIELFRKKTNPFANIGWTFLGLIYIAWPISMLCHAFTPWGFLIPFFDDEIRVPPYQPLPAIMFFVLIWVSDSMAYVCGRLFGKHKLWERISPKKTWEGFIGGLIFTMITAGMVANWFMANPHTYHTEKVWLIMAFLISVTGMLGDLTESLFKRSIDVKDSGTILPGHGGILDRFDALFLAVPFAITVYIAMDGTPYFR